MTGTAAIGRHVVIVTAAGSFTVEGRLLTGPVDTVGKLGKLILWTRERGGLQPIPGCGDQSVPGRVWVTGAAAGLLIGAADGHAGEQVGRLGQGMAPLVDEGWELRGGVGAAVVLAHGRGPRRVEVEVVVEQEPWLAGGDVSVAEDAQELGRRLSGWYRALGVLPGTGAAVSGAVLADQVMAARAGRRGAVVSEPGLLPGWATPELRIQPAWSATPDQAEQELRSCAELVCLTQQSPALASAGMLTFGYGPSRPLNADAAVAAAFGQKRPFGLWLIELPAADELDLPKNLPLPHPQMATGHRVQAWVTTEDIEGMAKDIRDGGAAVSVEQLAISEAIIWPQKARVLEVWATRLREARESFAADPALLALVDAAASEYLVALADPDAWASEDLHHHFQPAWAATIAAHIRFRGRRAAMRISREYQTWPLYVDDALMVYGPSPALPGSDGTSAPVNLSDSHTRLGRLITTARAGLSEQTILAMLLAESTGDVAAALTAALGLVPGGTGRPESGVDLAAAAPETTNDDAAHEKAEKPADRASTRIGAGSENAQESAAAAVPAGHDAARGTSARRRRTTGDARPAKLGGSPAAVLHTDGLWMPDGTKHDVPESITHVGHVAELAYTYGLCYELTPGYGEPGQIWITEDACRAYGIDVDTVLEKKPKDRDGVLREVTHDLPFVVDAVADGWTPGGGREGEAPRLGIWTRLYRSDQQRAGVWVVLIPGMAAGGDSPQDVKNVPILIKDPDDEDIDLPAPGTIARRLKLLADALRFPFKITPGVTAIDLMVASRPKGTTIKDWKNGPLAPSTFDVPFTVNDVEREFNWTRPPTAEELRCLFVHAYDRGGSYAAVAGMELPIGEPVHFPDGSMFEDPERLVELINAPGLVTIVVPESQDWRVPFLLNPAGRKFSAPKPVTTARLRHAVLKQEYKPIIVEAYTWPRHGRVLNGFYERVRDASLVLDTKDPDDQVARNQSKVVRNVAFGLLGSEANLKGKTGYDPMKRLSIVGKANANIAYRLDEIGADTGRFPVAVEKDTVLYVSDDPDPRAGWPGKPETWGRGFGQYKHEGSALLADHVQYLSGSDYRGKPALLDPNEWGELLPTLPAPGDAKEAR